MTEQKSNLFQFAAAIMAQAGTGATKVVRRQIEYAGLPGTTLDGVPDDIRGHASLLSLSRFRNSSEYSSLANPGMREPCIQQLLGP